MENDLSKLTVDAAKMLNYREHAKQLDIPLLKEFKVLNDNNPQTVLLATGSGFTEQLVSDGFIVDDEFEKRIDEVITNTKKFMLNNNCENVDNSFTFYKDYNNGVFNFKLYFQDIVIKGKVIKTLIAFFIEPKMHDFYQFSLSVGPYEISESEFKVGVIDLNNDKYSMALNNVMEELLNHLKYNNN